MLDKWKCGDYKPGQYKRLHGWAFSGVKRQDVSRIIEDHRVALIECELQEAIRLHHSEHSSMLKFNYIYICPPDTEEL